MWTLILSPSALLLPTARLASQVHFLLDLFQMGLYA